MKLVDKFTLWFVAIVFLVTPVSMSISYHNIKRNIDRAEAERLKDVNDHIANQLRRGEPTSRYTEGQPIKISEISKLPSQTIQVSETSLFNNDLKRNECRLIVDSYYSIGDKHYRISSFNYVTKSDQIISGMLQAVGWKMLLIVICVTITARFVSRKVFHPFNQALATIQGFSLVAKEKVQLPTSGTREFRELNGFLQKMTDKAVEDYAALKEFSENASHELQTPLAVLRSKLDLLAETGIHEEQAGLITDMQNAVEKLSKINHSLTLLTRLENHEYESKERILICEITREILAAYEDRIELKSIEVVREVDKRVALQLHPTLADIMMNNLIGNAIRHNIENGKIELTLTASELIIRNTGRAPEIPTSELFQRFKKSNQCSDSIGLGLAIVKQICDLNSIEVTYHYADDWHTVRLGFPGRVVIAEKQSFLSDSVEYANA